MIEDWYLLTNINTGECRLCTFSQVEDVIRHTVDPPNPTIAEISLLKVGETRQYIVSNGMNFLVKRMELQ